MLTEFRESGFTEPQQATLNEVRARLSAGHTVQRVAWLSGVDVPALERILSGQPARQFSSAYDDPETTEAVDTLAEWLKGEHKGASEKARYAFTPTFNQLQTLYAQAIQWGLLVAVTGAWGIGKSEAARYYAANNPRAHDRAGAVRVEFCSSDRTHSAALAKIAEHLNIGGHAYRNGSHMSAIVAALRPGDMLILEECQELKEAAGLIADIYDATGAAVVMQGNPEMTGMIWGKGAKFARLASRANRFDFPQSQPEDVDAWLAWKGAGEGLAIPQRKALSEAAGIIACRPTQNGGLRALADTFRLAENVYGQAVDAGMLLSMAAQLKPDAPGAARGKR